MTDKYVRGSDTSFEAAIMADLDAPTQRAAVLGLLRRARPDGYTDHEMQMLLQMNPSTQRPRRVELVERGWVKDSGWERETPSGRWAVVWAAEDDMGLL